MQNASISTRIIFPGNFFNPQVNALATIMIVVVSAGAFLAWWLMYREEKRKQRDMQLALQDNG